MRGVLDGEVEGLSRCERRNVTCTAQGKFGECTSNFLRSQVMLLLMLTLVALQRALGSMALSRGGFVGCTSNFLGLLVMLLLMLTMVVPQQALGSMRRSFEVGMMRMEDECD